MFELWHLHRRATIIAAALTVGLVTLLGLTALVVRVSGVGSQDSAPLARPTSAVAAGTGSAEAAASATPVSDVQSWDAIPPVNPATSATYPAISSAAAADPAAFARAFVSELFTRSYTSGGRAELISWAQAEDAPLRSTSFPASDWTKVLVDSLTDLTWDGADATPIPAQGPWLVLGSQHARQRVSEVTVRVDPQWESQVASGYQPPDSLSTVQDVSCVVTQVGKPGQAPTRYDVSLAVQLGTAPNGGYGAAATNDYVVREVA